MGLRKKPWNTACVATDEKLHRISTQMKVVKCKTQLMLKYLAFDSPSQIREIDLEIFSVR